MVSEALKSSRPRQPVYTFGPLAHVCVDQFTHVSTSAHICHTCTQIPAGSLHTLLHGRWSQSFCAPVQWLTKADASSAAGKPTSSEHSLLTSKRGVTRPGTLRGTVMRSATGRRWWAMLSMTRASLHHTADPVKLHVSHRAQMVSNAVHDTSFPAPHSRPSDNACCM